MLVCVDDMSVSVCVCVCAQSMHRCTNQEPVSAAIAATSNVWLLLLQLDVNDGVHLYY